MRWSKSITMVEAHAEGEVGRVITGGMIDVPGATMAQKLAYMNGEGDELRRFIVQEPRGSAQMSTIMLPPATRDDADIGFIVLQGDKAHAMSGSNCICAVTVLLETGMIEMQPETTVVLDTASGPVIARADCSNGKCQRVTLEMTPCYVDQMDEVVYVDGLGEVRFSIVYGGIFYALIDPAQINLNINPESARQLVDAGSRIQRAINSRYNIQHPEIVSITGLSYVMFISEVDDGLLKGATILPPGRIDRSPCGTGTSARMALMRKKGLIKLGDSFTARSIIDSEFQVTLLRDVEVCGRPGVVPQISGRGWIHGMHQIGLDPSDPYPHGFMVADCWGDAFDLVNA